MHRAAAGSFGVRRYHCLRGGKVVVSAGPAQGDGRSILVFARAPEAIARRQREFELLARLARLPAQISRQIPRPEYADEVAGARLFVLQEFSGVTLDAPVEGLETATREGAEFLARLHRATARRVRVAAADFEAVCGPMFEAARDRYPALAQALARARGALAAGLAGLEIPLVWLHGDFKVENLVVDARSSRLCGVIDWELSEPEGLPMLDLWYLLLYNRQIRDGTHFFPAVADLVPPRRLPGAEAALCGEYARALGLPEAATPALALALIVHHCARRVFYDNHDGARMASIAGTIEACVRWIERGAPPGARRDA